VNSWILLARTYAVENVPAVVLLQKDGAVHHETNNIARM